MNVQTAAVEAPPITTLRRRRVRATIESQSASVIFHKPRRLRGGRAYRGGRRRAGGPARAGPGRDGTGRGCGRASADRRRRRRRSRASRNGADWLESH